jgi:hypothetical protein
MDREEYDDIMRTLVRIAAQQSEFNRGQWAIGIHRGTEADTTMHQVDDEPIYSVVKHGTRAWQGLWALSLLPLVLGGCAFLAVALAALLAWLWPLLSP